MTIEQLFKMAEENDAKRTCDTCGKPFRRKIWSEATSCEDCLRAKQKPQPKKS